MFEIVILVCCLFLSAVGFSALLGRLWVALLKPKKCKKGNFVVLLDGENDVAVIDYYLEKYRWYGDGFADELYFVHNGNISDFARTLCESFSNVHFCSYTQLKDFLMLRKEE